MSRLIVVMPMAGDGQRFKDAGYDIPKPLIEVDGKPLFIHSIESLSFRKLCDVYYLFVCRKDHDKDGQLSVAVTEEMAKIGHMANEFSIVHLDYKTRGSLETIMTALDAYKEKEPLANDTRVLSIDCDFGFRCNSYISLVEHEVEESNECHPALMTFYAKDPKYSFMKPMLGRVERTAEKNPISSYAIAGCYFLGEYGKLLDMYEKYVNDYEDGKTDLKEIYVSGIYNYLINDGTSVIYIDMNFHTDMLWSFNVPVDLENYDKNKSIWDR